MRTQSIVLSTALCITSAAAVMGFLAHQRDLEDADAFSDGAFSDVGLDAASSDIDVDVGVAHNSLTGKLLVAEPGMMDPYFAGTVIYMLADDDDGSLGVVLNRPRGAVVHGGALAHLWDGGPVGRDRVFVLHDDLTSDGSVNIGGVAVAAEPSILDDVMDGKGPDHARVFVGYAGWGPGQLDRELERGSWLVAPASQAMVLSDDASVITRDATMHARRP